MKAGNQEAGLFMQACSSLPSTSLHRQTARSSKSPRNSSKLPNKAASPERQEAAWMDLSLKNKQVAFIYKTLHACHWVCKLNASMKWRLS